MGTLSTHACGVSLSIKLTISGVEPAAIHAPHSPLLRQQQFINDGKIWTNTICAANVPITIAMKYKLWKNFSNTLNSLPPIFLQFIQLKI